MSGFGTISAASQPTDLYVGTIDPRIANPYNTAIATLTYVDVARLTKFRVTRTVIVTKATIVIGTSAGNIDVGVYSESGTRLASTGSIASPGTGQRDVTFTAGVTLAPSIYWIAIVPSDATFSALTISPVYQVPTANNPSRYFAGSFPLPTSLTMPGTGDAFGIVAWLE
jgi:hypothetical protein